VRKAGNATDVARGSNQLVKSLLTGLIDQLAQKKLALASRNLSQVESLQQSLAGLLNQLQKADKTSLAAFPVECHTIHQLTHDINTLLRSEHQRVSAVLALFANGTYLADGQPVMLTVPSQECVA
jgi:hypothetical protein